MELHQHILPVRRSTWSWPALFSGESNNAISSWWAMSGHIPLGSRPCFDRMERKRCGAVQQLKHRPSWS